MASKPLMYADGFEPDSGSSYAAGFEPDASAAPPPGLIIGAGGSISAKKDRRHSNRDAFNNWGWLAPVGATIGGMYGGPGGAALLAGSGTYLDQELNRLQNTPFAPRPGLSGALQSIAGVAGNMLLGGAAEMVPPKILGAAGRYLGPKIGKALYKEALNVSPELSEAFPKVNIPNEAWAQGAPELSIPGSAVAKGTTKDRAREVRRLLDVAQSASRTEPIYRMQDVAVPGTTTVRSVYDLPMTDPQAGAHPMVDYLPPATRPRLDPGTEYPDYPNLLHPPGGQTADAYWQRPPSVEQRMIAGERPTLMRPRNVLPMEQQQVTFSRQVPVKKVQSGWVAKVEKTRRLNPNPAAMVKQSPELRKLSRDLSSNLEAGADRAEVRSIVDTWVADHADVTNMNDMYTLAQKAGEAGDYVPPTSLEGRAAQLAVTPNKKLTGTALRTAITKHLDNLAESVGVTGLREARSSTQKAIAAQNAVHDAAMRGNPTMNAAGAIEKHGILNRIAPGRRIGNVGAYLGGKRPNPSNSVLFNTLFKGSAAAAGRLPGVAVTSLPWLLTQPNPDSTQGGSR